MASEIPLLPDTEDADGSEQPLGEGAYRAPCLKSVTLREEVDLSVRAAPFRRRVVGEFRLEDSVAASVHAGPKHTTADLQANSGRSSQLLTRMLLHNPCQLIKFKVFRRSQDASRSAAVCDKRLVRVRNVDHIPLGVWAAWVTNNRFFTGFVFLLILCNAVAQGVQIEMTREGNPDALDYMSAFDDFTVVMFAVEIALKWIDSFRGFWRDGWNVFDFVITVLSAVPRVVSITAGGGDSSGFASVAGQFRLFRSLRLLKMVARLRSLRVVISTVIEAFGSLGFILLLLLMLTYIFGVFAVNLFFPYTESTDPTLQYQYKFQDLPSAFMTLFQLLTLDQWYLIQQDIRKVVEPAIVIAFFIFWVWIGAFIFRNVFVGVMVRKFDEMTSKAKRVDAEERSKRRQARKLRSLNRELKKNARQASMANVLASQRNLAAAEAEKKERAEAARAEQTAAAPDAGDERQSMAQWREVVSNTLEALEKDKTESVWPRDTLLEYLLAMKELQNNMAEQRELQVLAAGALHRVFSES